MTDSEPDNTPWITGTDEPLAVAATNAIHSGDVGELRRLLAEHPRLAFVHLGSPPSERDAGMTRSLLHVATDWPGHFPNVGQTITALVEAGADVDARFTGPHTETPLHWAASSDDLEALDALLDLGANIEADGAVIGGGTPLSDATAFGNWAAGHRLIERGAVPKLWEAAALGLVERAQAMCESSPPSADDVTHAFWSSCHGGQRSTAELFRRLGADVNWVGYDDLTPLEAAERSEAEELATWLVSIGAKRAAEL